MSHADVTLLAEAVAPGAEGVNFLPYLLGERTPNWPHSSGAVLGLRQGKGGVTMTWIYCIRQTKQAIGKGKQEGWHRSKVQAVLNFCEPTFFNESQG